MPDDDEIVEGGDPPRPVDYAPPEPHARGWLHRHRRWIWAAVGLIGVVAGGALIAVLSWYVPFQQRMQDAADHAAKLRQIVGGDPRFADVGFLESTGDNGTLLVQGVVWSEPDLAALKQIVADSKPPVRYYILAGLPTNPAATRRATTTRAAGG